LRERENSRKKGGGEKKEYDSEEQLASVRVFRGPKATSPTAQRKKGSN